MVKHYRKKPVIISAVQLGPELADFEEANEFMENIYPINDLFTYHCMGKIPIDTLEGTMLCKIGDYIVQGVEGEFYPCRGDIFEKTYEQVDL